MKDFANREVSEVRVYSLRDHGEDYVSEHFKVKEFACKDGSDVVLIHPQLPLLLEEVREKLDGRPIHVLSGFRTPSHNKREGGAVRSMHLYGMAADVWSNHFTPQQVQDAFRQLGAGGIGVYPNFIHGDVGPEREWGG